mgnify:CR=1 FL=1
MPETISLRDDKVFEDEAVLHLYQRHAWSAAQKPKQLLAALRQSHSLILAFAGTKLVGLGSALSDGHLVVYYPHLLVDPDYQGQGVGRLIMEQMQKRYGHLHQQMLTADAGAVDFYKRCGFEQAGDTTPMWIYQGHEHG